jgi:hypothetical protein
MTSGAKKAGVPEKKLIFSFLEERIVEYPKSIKRILWSVVIIMLLSLMSP